jgi:hypothetical protein
LLTGAQSGHGSQDIFELEWFAHQLTLAVVDQHLGALGDISGDEERPGAQVWLQRDGEMEQDVTTDVRDSQVQHEHVEGRAA